MKKFETTIVVHGRWVWDEESECWLCNKCGYAALNNYRGNSVASNYCPHCGTNMEVDNGKEEES